MLLVESLSHLREHHGREEDLRYRAINEILCADPDRSILHGRHVLMPLKLEHVAESGHTAVVWPSVNLRFMGGSGVAFGITVRWKTVHAVQ